MSGITTKFITAPIWSYFSAQSAVMRPKDAMITAPHTPNAKRSTGCAGVGAAQ